MKPNLTLTLVFFTLMVGMIFSVAQGTVITVEGGSIPVIGEIREFTIIADELPEGLLGYSLTVTLTDPSKAEMVDVLFPEWAPSYPYSYHTLTPADEVDIKIFAYQVNTGKTNVTLATLRIRGDMTGQTNVDVIFKTFQDEKGKVITPTVVPGTISVGGVVPTATVTTTATTTLPSPTVTTTSSTTTATVTTTATTAIPTPTATTTNATPTATSTTTTTTVTTTATTAIPTPTPTPQEPAYITVFSYPLGGSVALDGTTIGKTPLQEYPVEPGTHTLTATYPGYREYSTTLTVSPGEHKRLPLIIFMKVCRQRSRLLSRRSQ